MKDFFGFGGYTRPAEGFLSWQHLLFVSILMVIMTSLAFYFGLKNKKKNLETKNKVLIWSAILIDGFELFKIILMCFRSKAWGVNVNELFGAKNFKGRNRKAGQRVEGG